MSIASKQRWEVHKAKEREKFLIRKDMPLWNQMCKDYKSGELFKANRCLHYPETWTDPIIDRRYNYLCRVYKTYIITLRNIKCVTCGDLFNNSRLAFIRYYYPIKGRPYTYQWLNDEIYIKSQLIEDPLNNLTCKSCGTLHRIWAREPLQIRLAKITINNITRHGKQNEHLRA